METLTWIALGLVLIVGLAWYLTYSAARLDRLHAKVEGSLAALDAQTIRRAESALELGMAGLLDPASSLIVVDAATQSLERSAHNAGMRDEDLLRGGTFAGRESAESHLSEALALALTPESIREVRLRGGGQADGIVHRLHAAALRVQLARRFHNQAVTDVQRVRRKRVVRLFRLAGRAPMPRTVEFDDTLPPQP
ncbi:MAG: hypothetical protein Q4G67_08785 [Actinomycetia bacterium]|nr:hypothetical protein [Actinomycetes bacterium]